MPVAGGSGLAPVGRAPPAAIRAARRCSTSAAAADAGRVAATLPGWPALTMMSANCSGSVSRPRVLMVSWNCWPLGTGCWPIWPAATCRFCWAMAVTTSAAVSPRAASLSGSIQARRL